MIVTDEVVRKVAEGLLAEPLEIVSRFNEPLRSEYTNAIYQRTREVLVDALGDGCDSTD